MQMEERLTSSDWNLYDTRHTVFKPKRIGTEGLEAGYWSAYREFYRWDNIIRAAQVHTALPDQIRHMAYAGGWKKFEPMWDWVIRAKRVANFLPILETMLAGNSARNKNEERLEPTAYELFAGFVNAVKSKRSEISD